MATKVALNGFGRIGRLVFRAMVERGLLGKEIDLAAIVEVHTNADYLVYQLRYDSAHLRWEHDLKTEKSDPSLEENDIIVVDGKHRIQCLQAASKPADLDWKPLGVDYVVDATGIFNDYDKAIGHVEAGARKVLLTAPGKGPVQTIVMGVNEGVYKPGEDKVVSNASCTTNCLAPAAKVLNDGWGIEQAYMTTIHAYTNDQRILDLPHSDARRARAAALNIIPTTTGAAKAVALVIPELKGKFDGMAMRVPTPTVSIVDFVATVKKDITAADLNKAFKAAAEGEMKGILAFTDEPLVSMDFKGHPASSIIDGMSTSAMGRMVKVVTWYDNEWGYSNRVGDLINFMSSRQLVVNA